GSHCLWCELWFLGWIRQPDSLQGQLHGVPVDTIEDQFGLGPRQVWVHGYPSWASDTVGLILDEAERRPIIGFGRLYEDRCHARKMQVVPGLITAFLGFVDGVAVGGVKIFQECWVFIFQTVGVVARKDNDSARFILRIPPFIGLNDVCCDIFWMRQHRVHMKWLQAQRPGSIFVHDKKVFAGSRPTTADPKEIVHGVGDSVSGVALLIQAGPGGVWV